MLQNMLEELMTWYASLLHSLVDHESHPDMANARKLASLDQRLWQQERRENKTQARAAMVQGHRIVAERDSKKRTFQEMSATEQQLHAPAAAAATEPSPELPADKQMIYAIVNEFLGTDTFNNPEAEASLLDTNTWPAPSG